MPSAPSAAPVKEELKEVRKRVKKVKQKFAKLKPAPEREPSLLGLSECALAEQSIRRENAFRRAYEAMEATKRKTPERERAKEKLSRIVDKLRSVGNEAYWRASASL